jgi:hypothetical protein
VKVLEYFTLIVLAVKSTLAITPTAPVTLPTRVFPASKAPTSFGDVAKLRITS